MTHRLVIMRHAKSSWKEPLPDHQRPLNKRGRRDGRAAGEWLAAHVGTVDRVLSSTSTRTRLTWERVEAGGGSAGQVTFHDALYGGSTEDFLRLLHTLPESVGTALVLAHWPGVEEAVRELAPRDDNPGWTGIDTKFPTSAIALLDVPGTWADLTPGGARLLDYVVPRG
ncbi:MAG: histidine phosphatase family protein [Corynebacterium humireducens]|jgi:phosphohistidine phosphatase|uniref:Histidine phosphatase family protein n=1 Tax=Corynebacterium humireducens TaxID=1223514 RepID=A0A7X6SVK6_9CORY|nr:histidine phosphatase family protein [Corynebacterium humireducens]